MSKITLVTQDRKGLLVDITTALAQADVNIDSISAQNYDTDAVLHLHLSDVHKGLTVLQEAGFTVVSDDLITVRVPDQPGALANLAKILSDDGALQIHGVSTLQRQQGHSVVAIDTSDNDKARQLLQQYLV
jgi:hypothetical protein